MPVAGRCSGPPTRCHRHPPAADRAADAPRPGAPRPAGWVPVQRGHRVCGCIHPRPVCQGLGGRWAALPRGPEGAAAGPAAAAPPFSAACAPARWPAPLAATAAGVEQDEQQRAGGGGLPSRRRPGRRRRAVRKSSRRQARAAVSGAGGGAGERLQAPGRWRWGGSAAASGAGQRRQRNPSSHLVCSLPTKLQCRLTTPPLPCRSCGGHSYMVGAARSRGGAALHSRPTAGAPAGCALVLGAWSASGWARLLLPTRCRATASCPAS